MGTEDLELGGWEGVPIPSDEEMAEMKREITEEIERGMERKQRALEDVPE